MKRFIGSMLTGVVVVAVVLMGLADVTLGAHMQGNPRVGDGITSGAIKDRGSAPTPELATMFFLGSALIGLGEYGRRKFFKK